MAEKLYRGIASDGLLFDVLKVNFEDMTASCQSHPSWGEDEGWLGWLRCRFERFEEVR